MTRQAAPKSMIFAVKSLPQALRRPAAKFAEQKFAEFKALGEKDADEYAESERTEMAAEAAASEVLFHFA